MGRVRGLRDINTHGSLDRRGLLIGVAKNMHQGTGIGSGRRETESDFSGDVSRHVFRKPAPAKRPVRPATHSSLYPDPKLVREYLISISRDLLKELRQAAAEGLPVATTEIDRLHKRLKDLGVAETERK